MGSAFPHGVHYGRRGACGSQHRHLGYRGAGWRLLMGFRVVVVGVRLRILRSEPWSTVARLLHTANGAADPLEGFAARYRDIGPPCDPNPAVGFPGCRARMGAVWAKLGSAGVQSVVGCYRECPTLCASKVIAICRVVTK